MTFESFNKIGFTSDNTRYDRKYPLLVKRKVYVHVQARRVTSPW